MKRLEPGSLIAPAPAFVATKCRDADVAAEIQRRTGTTVEVSFTAAAMVRHGLGIALVDPFTGRFFEFQGDLVARALGDGPTHDLMLAQPRQLTASRLQGAFAEALLRGVNAIREPNDLAGDTHNLIT